MEIALGVLCGGVQFLLLHKMVSKIAGGAVSAFVIFFGAAQFLLPGAALLCVAFLAPARILGCGIALASTLLLLSAGFFARSRLFIKKRKGGESD